MLWPPCAASGRRVRLWAWSATPRPPAGQRSERPPLLGNRGFQPYFAEGRPRGRRPAPSPSWSVVGLGLRPTALRWASVGPGPALTPTPQPFRPQFPAGPILGHWRLQSRLRSPGQVCTPTRPGGHAVPSAELLSAQAPCWLCPHPWWGWRLQKAGFSAIRKNSCLGSSPLDLPPPRALCPADSKVGSGPHQLHTQSHLEARGRQHPEGSRPISDPKWTCHSPGSRWEGRCLSSASLGPRAAHGWGHWRAQLSPVLGRAPCRGGDPRG